MHGEVFGAPFDAAQHLAFHDERCGSIGIMLILAVSGAAGTGCG